MSHIGIDARLPYYRTGGISTYVVQLMHALSREMGDHQYWGLESRKLAVTNVPDGFQRARLWTPCHHRLERVALSVELARFRFDVFHSPDFIPPLRGAKKHVITVHDLTFLHYPQFLTEESRRYYNDQIEAAVTHADHILTDSEASKRDMVTLLGVPAGKITVHMLGIDPHFYRPDADTLAAGLRELKLSAGYLLFVGTFEPRKNLIGLLTAYKMLLERGDSPPPIVLAGTRGWKFEQVRAEIDALALGDRVIWRENVAQSLLPALYAGAMALITPSFYEGFGLPALEAMACGTVPIVSNRSSLPEVTGDVGLTIDPDDPLTIADAIRRVMHDAAWRVAHQQHARIRAQSFTWENTAAIVRRVYESV
jgi:glycosyltransferase involved in cell wall biosynthesis